MDFIKGLSMNARIYIRRIFVFNRIIVINLSITLKV